MPFYCLKLGNKTPGINIIGRHNFLYPFEI